ncbi:MAG TPA: MFS transporter [Actinomycetota bacterium]|nr:MFS transporter [Actinomycetota bacterium]
MQDANRSRAARVLFVAVAFATTAYVASITVAPLVGRDLASSAALSGLPWAAGILGTGLGSVPLAQFMARFGRGPGLVLGYVTGGIGTVLAVGAIANGQFWFFVAAVIVMGAGNAAAHLSRYAAADLYPARERASALGMLVWAGAIGGVAGPALLDPSARASANFALPRLAGPFIVGAIGYAIAIAAIGALLRRTPSALVPHDLDAGVSNRSVVDMWRAPRAQIAVVALAVAQMTMVMVMAMTPVHMRDHGHGLGAVGFVISLHVFGMYGLSPISGHLAGRFGGIQMVVTGFAVLGAGALVAAVVPPVAGLWLAVPLFLLGWGWSLTFVAGSALLTHGLTYGDRTRLQGATDAVTWAAAGVAGLSSGVLVGSFGYAVLCVIGAGLVIVPVLLITRFRRRLVFVQSSFDSKSSASELMQ